MQWPFRYVALLSVFPVTCGQSSLKIIKWEIPDMIYFLTFKLHNILNTTRESYDILLQPTQDMNRLSWPNVYTLYTLPSWQSFSIHELSNQLSEYFRAYDKNKLYFT